MKSIVEHYVLTIFLGSVELHWNIWLTKYQTWRRLVVLCEHNKTIIKKNEVWSEKIH